MNKSEERFWDQALEEVYGAKSAPDLSQKIAVKLDKERLVMTGDEVELKVLTGQAESSGRRRWLGVWAAAACVIIGFGLMWAPWETPGDAGKPTVRSETTDRKPIAAPKPTDPTDTVEIVAPDPRTFEIKSVASLSSSADFFDHVRNTSWIRPSKNLYIRDPVSGNITYDLSDRRELPDVTSGDVVWKVVVALTGAPLEEHDAMHAEVSWKTFPYAMNLVDRDGRSAQIDITGTGYGSSEGNLDEPFKATVIKIKSYGKVGVAPEYFVYKVPETFWPALSPFFQVKGVPHENVTQGEFEEVRDFFDHIRNTSWIRLSKYLHLRDPVSGNFTYDSADRGVIPEITDADDVWKVVVALTGAPMELEDHGGAEISLMQPPYTLNFVDLDGTSAKIAIYGTGYGSGADNEDEPFKATFIVTSPIQSLHDNSIHYKVPEKFWAIVAPFCEKTRGSD